MKKSPVSGGRIQAKGRRFSVKILLAILYCFGALANRAGADWSSTRIVNASAWLGINTAQPLKIMQLSPDKQWLVVVLEPGTRLQAIRLSNLEKNDLTAGLTNEALDKISGIEFLSDNEHVVFSRPHRLYLANLNGMMRREITTDLSQPYFGGSMPRRVFSATTQFKIVYIAGGQVVVENLSGTDKTVLSGSIASDGYSDYIHITADGMKVVYATHDANFRHKLFVVNMDGTGRRELLPPTNYSGLYIADFLLSPDSHRVAAMGYGITPGASLLSYYSEGALFAGELSDTRLRTLVPSTDAVRMLDIFKITPDSQHVLYEISTGSFSGKLCSVNINTGGQVVLSEKPGARQVVNWFTSGEISPRLVFENEQTSGESKLYAVSYNGTAAVDFQPTPRSNTYFNFEVAQSFGRVVYPTTGTMNQAGMSSLDVISGVGLSFFSGVAPRFQQFVGSGAGSPWVYFVEREDTHDTLSRMHVLTGQTERIRSTMMLMDRDFLLMPSDEMVITLDLPAGMTPETANVLDVYVSRPMNGVATQNSDGYR